MAMAKKTIQISGTATQMVGDINDNFVELYSRQTIPTENIKVYDVMGRSGNGSGASIYVAADIKAGMKYYIEKGEVGTNWDYEIIKTTTSGKSPVQTLLSTTGGTTTVGGYNTEITATSDAAYFNIESYSSGKVNIYHYEDVPTLGATRWLGKRWLVFGDSITTEHGSLASVGYAELVARSLGMYRVNVAVSGKNTLNYLEGFADQGKTYKWDAFSTKYDLVTVMLGANDQGYNCPVGTISDTSTSSFFGRIKMLYENLRGRYPKSVIALITPIKRYNANGDLYTNAQGLSTEPYAQAVVDVCKYYSIPCIDIYYNTIDPRTQTARDNFFCNADGTHPNALGHKLFIAPVIEARLRDIAPFYFNDWESLNSNE